MVDQKLPDNFKHIVRVANVDIPGDKPVSWALTKIKGVGINFATVACVLAGIEKTKKAGYLTEEEVKKLNQVVQDPLKNGLPLWMCNRKKDYDTGETKHLLGGNLTFTFENDIKRLKRIHSLRGVRHSKGLTVRGQRTKSNFRKNKGKVVGVVKKAAAPSSEGSKDAGGKKDAGKKK